MTKLYGILILFIGFSLNMQAQCPLTCNDNVYISLSQSCEHQLTVDDVLENPGSNCNYSLEVYDENGNFFPGTVLDGSLVGQTIGVKVSLPNGNFCESWVRVQDNKPPVFNCTPDVTLACYENNGTGLPPVYDNCDPNPQVIILSDNYTDLPCSSQFTGERVVSYKARDASGNETDVCTQTIRYTRPDIEDVYFPLDRDGSPLPPLDCNNPVWDLDGDGYPDPEETGVPTLEGYDLFPTAFCDLTVTYEDLIWPLNCGTKIMRTWTVIDECSGETKSAAQIIKLTSTTAPTLICPPDQTVSASGPDCNSDVVLPTPNVSGNGGCGGSASYTVSIPGVTVINQNGVWIARDLSPGVYYVKYTASSTCSNQTSTCTVKLTVVEGGSGPIPVCDQNTTVSVGINGTARVYAETFNDGSYDDCGNVTIKVRRMNPGNCPPGVIDDTHFRNFIEVCCADIGASPIQVILQVTGSSGQTNQCMVLLTVQDKLPPTITCPPSITIDCDYPFDLNNLDVFGSVVTKPSQRENIVIYDVPGGRVVGKDGLAQDNCDVTVTSSYYTNIECNQGTITRVFKATDSGGRTTTCTQRIYVQGTGNGGSFIDWPDNVTINECNSNKTHPDFTGYPTWSNSDCSLLAYSYKDEVYRFASGGCIKILRYWKVLDWCIYDPDTGYGLYTDIQVIKITDDEKPVMVDNCKDRQFCTTSGQGCKGYINYNPVFEDCTPMSHLEFDVEIDLFSNGTIDEIKTSGNLSGNYPFGTHTINWRVSDGCGNTFRCTNQITVDDCKKPTPVCFHGLTTVIMPETGNLGFSVRHFNHKSFDNCTEKEDLRLSFSPDLSDTIKFYDCDDLGVDTVQLWVTDEAGNSNYCTSYVQIQDNMNGCPDSATTMVSGLIRDENDNPIDNSNVIISHSGLNQLIFNTDSDGFFEFESRIDYNLNNVNVLPYKNDDALNGVTAYDLYVLFKAIQGDMTFTNSYDMIASDVNNDQQFTIQDVLQLRQLLLGVYDEFPQNTSWTFINNNPGIDNDEPYIYFNDASVSIPSSEEVHFTGVKIADVNGSAESGLQSEGRTNEKFDLVYEDMDLEKGKSYTVTLYATDNIDMQSFQIYFDQLDSDLIIEDVSTTTDSDSWQNVTGQMFSLVSFTTDAVKYSKDVEMYSIKVTANRNMKLSEELALSIDRPSMIANAEGVEFDVILRSKVPTTINQSVSVKSYPNPVKQAWSLRIAGVDAQEMTIQVYNTNGKLLVETDKQLSSGAQDIQVSEINHLKAGVYFYQVKLKSGIYKGSIVKL